MRTVDYIDVLNGACELAYGTTTNQPPTDQWARWRRLISKRLADAWERARWPDLTRTEQRAFRAEYAAATTYSKTNEVFYVPSQLYYQSLRDSNTGNAPATSGVENSAYWAQCRTSYSPNRGTWASGVAYAVGDQVIYETTNRYYQCHTAHTSSGTLIPTATGGNERWGVLTAFDRYVAYEQTGETKIGAVFAVSNNSPYLTYAQDPVEFALSNNGVQVMEDVPEVWLMFRLQCPTLTGDTFSATATYAVGDQIYWSSTATPGNFYECLTATSAGEDPDDTPAKWDLVEIPLMFERYLVQGAYADWLPGDGQNEKKLAELAYGERLIADQVSQLRAQQQQRGRVTVVTR